jgi:hypothetical protein
MWKRARGGVLTEFAVVAPVLILFVIGGWVVSHVAYSKMALTMIAGQVARDFAGSPELYKQLVGGASGEKQYKARKELKDAAYRFEAFGETYGLPHHRVHALVGWETVGEDQKVIVVATCYRVPLGIPEFNWEAPGPILPDTSEDEEAVEWVADTVGSEELHEGLEQFREVKEDLESELQDWRGVYNDGVSLWEQARRIWARAEGLVKQARQMIYPEDDWAERQTGGKDIEVAAERLCQPMWKVKGKPHESIVVTSKAAFLVEGDRHE